MSPGWPWQLMAVGRFTERLTALTEFWLPLRLERGQTFRRVRAHQNRRRLALLHSQPGGQRALQSLSGEALGGGKTAATAGWRGSGK